jgi:hypothetical protein
MLEGTLGVKSMYPQECCMQEREIRDVQENGRNYEPPVLVQLGSIEDLTHYDVSVDIG